MKRRTIFLFLFLLAFGWYELGSCGNLPQGPMTYPTTEQRLSNDTVFDIRCSREGFDSGFEGIDRFLPDGVNPGISRVAEAPDGTIWAVVPDYGIIGLVTDSVTQRLIPTLYRQENARLIGLLQPDVKGLVWFTQQNRLFSISATNQSPRCELQFPTDESITSIFPEGGGFLLIGTDTGSVGRFEGTTFHSFMQCAAPVARIFRDSHGTIWLVTTDGGLYFYNPTTDQSSHFAERVHPDTNANGKTIDRYPSQSSWRGVLIGLAVSVLIAFFVLSYRNIYRRTLANRRSVPIVTDRIAVNDTQDEDFMVTVVNYMEQHYTDSNLKVEDLARQSNMSRSSFFNRIKGLARMTPNEYIKHFRLRKAEAYLLETQLPISEIAYRTGFTDPAYFTMCFRMNYGVTPSVYRKRNFRS